MKDKLEIKFKELKGQFDLEHPRMGHFDRFEARLNNVDSGTKKRSFKLYSAISIAASIILFFGIWIGSSFSNNGMELAAISNEMSETQQYFITTIEREIEAIEGEKSEENKLLISDAMIQLTKLEDQYKLLTLELKESTEDQRIIYAMISNFQQRIELLQNLLEQLKEIRNLKTITHEDYA